jgi:hypothetical protein
MMKKPFPAEFEGAAFSNSLYDSLLSILLSLLLLSVFVHEKHTAERGMSIAAMIVFIFVHCFYTACLNYCHSNRGRYKSTVRFVLP